MVTTIQVRETTKQLLDRMKTNKKAESYDEIIKNLVEKEIKIQDMFGFTKNKPFKFKKEDEMKVHEI